jgi:plasmid maintenance system killer protein
LLIEYSERFLSSYGEAPPEIRKLCNKQILFLSQDIRHPSLRAKKYHREDGVWQVRVNRKWRFYFEIHEHSYYLMDVIPHPK